MTIIEKILANHSGNKNVKPGDYIWAKIDKTNAMTDTFKHIEELGIEEVFDSSKIYCVSDHSAPPANISTAEDVAEMRRYIKKYNIDNWFEYGRHGILHQLYPERGFVKPGDLIAMIDSHSTTYGAFNAASCAIYMDAIYLIATGEMWFKVPETIRFEISGDLPYMCMGKDIILKIAEQYGTDYAIYKAIEFGGYTINQLSLSGRWSMCNMAAELGAKFAVMEADNKVYEFLKNRISGKYEPVYPDKDADYAEINNLNVSNLEPLVACPHDPGNVTEARKLNHIKVDQALIGSCTNGRLEDFEIAARILKGRKVHPNVRLLIIPASMEVWKDVLQAGLYEIFIDSGALICHPTCGPCAGHHLGILGSGERCISSTNRNFKGRMGSPESEVYLGNPATVAASAISGYISDPREFI